MIEKKVSIILPVYNGEKTIKRCIESVKNQTYQNYELIVINDGSTDNTLSICEQMLDDKLFLINQKNGGVSSARNRGLLECHGKYLFFIYADDTYQSDYLEKIIADLDEYDLNVCGFNIINQKQTTQNKLNKEILTAEEAMCKIMKYEGMGGFLFNKAFCFEKVKENNITFDTSISYAEDLLFVETYLSHSSKVQVLDLCLYNYYIYENSLSHGEINKNHVTILKAFEKAWDLNDNSKYRDIILQRYYYQLLNLYLNAKQNVIKEEIAGLIKFKDIPFSKVFNLLDFKVKIMLLIFLINKKFYYVLFNAWFNLRN